MSDRQPAARKIDLGDGWKAEWLPHHDLTIYNPATGHRINLTPDQANRLLRFVGEKTFAKVTESLHHDRS